MKLDFYLVHDGDFRIDMKYFRELRKRYSYLSSVDYHYSSDGYSIQFTAEVKQKNNYPVECLARDVIEAVIKSVRFHHMFIMQYLYETYEELLEWLFRKGDEKEITHYWSGNYDGTEWTIIR